ncbi:MAG TPA: ATP-dependent helicase [Actinomycetes bacterium]|nr:ATP-dependent helicase [Actinomycetes bacterium]
MSALDVFTPQTRQWFEAVFDAPTPAQDAAWQAIVGGQNTLVVAPTGSGKTLAAFLWALDRCASRPDAVSGTTVLYVSPLKALAVDVERNLRAPLAGISNAYQVSGVAPPDITVAIRTGDTPAAERQRQLRRPSTILITTPESLYLLLTSQARDTLSSVSTVIVDEVHAVAGTKRGAHLALSLERLDHLLDTPAQRIGLSATVRPTDTVAAFLGGSRPVTVVEPPSEKHLDLSVVVPVEDLSTLGPSGFAPQDDVSFGSGDFALDDDVPLDATAPSIWPHVESRIVDLIDDHRSTIVFANSRRLTERLAARLNEEATRRAGAAAEQLSASASPAEVMAQAGATLPLPEDATEIARAHHGSVSREQRAVIEDELKQGTLPAVVATSSLELGIDMGAVDLVVQVESPPSVASGLQRIGRAGHQVGEVSRGVIFPKHRGDLLPTAVAVQRMRNGDIEHITVPRNPLDVLAQQIVAMTAMDEWTVDELGALVRRAHPFASLPDSALHAVLDMLAGRYPSDAFAELRPRLVWNRDTGVLTGRPGAQRIAVINGGTIPDRGLYGVFLAGGDGPGRRVGELDEEMVYESRVGDVFALGSTSWQIVDITHDQVLVAPAPGRAGKLPFWHGDAEGRPAEFSQAIGATIRQLRASTSEQAIALLGGLGLDDNAASNALAYVAEQHEACGVTPDDQTVVIEKFRDEIGDWRVVVHSLFGGRVNTPWAMAIAARLRDRLDMDVQVMPSDDGIVLRLPDLGVDPDTPPELLDHVLFEPDEVEGQVTDAVWGSALFAARFRECAARALLLPRRRPDRRTPLWQQRQRSAQLLGVASGHPTFPIVLETMRECLQDVFDVPGLRHLQGDLAAGRVRVVEVETPRASPFARSLLFSYVGAFLYEGDAPLAERRAAALTVDTGLLAELLGQAELRELLDPEAIDAVERRISWRTQERRLRDAEALADALRVLGPLTDDELAERGASLAEVAALAETRRIVRLRVAGEERWVAVEDLSRLRDALGIPLPPGVSGAFADAVPDPVGDLVGRFARTHGPFTTDECAASLGLGPAVVHETLHRLATKGQVVAGEFRPGGSGQEWCDADVLRQIRRASLAIAQQSIEPVSANRLATFLPEWQRVQARASGALSNSRGVDTLFETLDQLAGATAPASEWERSILPQRVPGYRPEWLDELTASGDVVWFGAGSLPSDDGWLGFVPAEHASTLLPDPLPIDEPTNAHTAVLNLFPEGTAMLTRSIFDALRDYSADAVEDALWSLVWSGHLTNDSLAAVRRRVSGDRLRRATRPGSPRLQRRQARRLPPRTHAEQVPGRWYLVPATRESATERAHALAESLLMRHGVVTRGVAASERVSGGYAALYRVLGAMEEAGHARRGYFVEGLGAAQFGSAAAIDELRREAQGAQPDGALVLAATDPANPFGAALPWPSSPVGHLPGRKAGATVVLDADGLALFVERGGRSVLTWCAADHPRAASALATLADAVREGRRPPVHLQKVDGTPVHESPWAAALRQAGFQVTPRGMRLRAAR